LKDDAWVAKVELGEDFTLENLYKFVNIWCLLQEVLHMEELEDTIT
jgi:hypothetical protein